MYKQEQKNIYNFNECANFYWNLWQNVSSRIEAYDLLFDECSKSIVKKNDAVDFYSEDFFRNLSLWII